MQVDSVRRTLTGDRNQCPGCGEYFNSVAAFDKHRTGQHGVDRRCRTRAEMAEIGMAVNSSGFFVTSLMTTMNWIKEEE